MGRGKVQLRLIENGSSRKSVYRKRLAGLKKKAYEISKLCDVPSLVISVDLDGKVETFPENKDEVCAILKKYNSVSNKVGEKYKQNSESVIQSQILKKQLELNQLRMENENMVSATVKFLDSMLFEVQGRILLQSCMQDFAFEEEVENGVDVGKLNGEKECEEVEMVTEESAHCNGHGDLPNLTGVEELLRGFESSFIDMNDMQMAAEGAGCHEHNDEFSVENLFKGSDCSGGDTNDPQIVTHLAAEESDHSIEESAYCNGHGDLPNFTGFEELLKGFESSFIDMNDMQMATEEAGCHEHNDEFSVENLFGSDSSGGDMNDPQIVTHLAAEESDHSTEESACCNGHGDLPNFTGVEEFLRRFEASFDGMNNMQMATEETGCHEHNKESDSSGSDMIDLQIVTQLAAEEPDQSNVFSCDLPSSTGVEELLKRFEASFDDMNNMQMITEEEAGCHEHNYEFSVENLFKGSDSSDGDMNDPQIVTHLVAEEPDQSNVFSGSCSDFSEHVPSSTCYTDDGHPYLFELSDFIQF